MSRSVLLLSLAASLAVPATAAQAQFGKLIKKAAQNVVQGASEAAASNGASSASNGSGNRGESAVEITPQSIDALLTALGPSMRAATAYENARASYEAQQAKYEAYGKCRTDVKRAHQNDVMVPSPATMQLQIDAGTQVAELMTRYAAAQQAGDAARTHALLDSASVIGERAENVLIPQLRTCGPHVGQPSGAKPEASSVPTPKVPNGMSATQFGLLRERVASWLLTNGQSRVSPNERSALDARKGDLAPLAPLFRGQALAWANWSDLSAQ